LTYTQIKRRPKFDDEWKLTSVSFKSI
jgi:hypothetical protein